MKRRAIMNLAYALLFVSLGCTKNSDTIVTRPPADTGDVVPPQPTGLTVKQMDNKGGNISSYLLYTPDTYNDKKDYRWPVVIFLHGVGEIGTDIKVLKNVGLPKVVAGKQFVMIAPQCTRNWWNIATLDILYKEILQKYHVDTTRIYLTGLSMGGYGTWDWAEASPGKFAAIVPISGAGNTANACVLKQLPVWAFHNADDPTVSVTGSRSMVNALKNCGSSLVKYTENPVGGHDAWTKAYADAALYEWMLKFKKS